MRSPNAAGATRLFAEFRGEDARAVAGVGEGGDAGDAGASVNVGVGGVGEGGQHFS